MSVFRPGDLVFVPCPDAAFIPGRVVQVGADDTVGVVLDSSAGAGDTDLRLVPSAEVCLRFERNDTSTSQDNTALVHMNEATILENLRLRHKQNMIYTYTASVLLAINPYKEISGLYGEEQCALYRGKHLGALPPHPYAISDTAYRALVRERRNQALLISGESGAGKTETAKIVMQFLSYASGSASELTSRIQARVLQAQPILESFGNAVTMRNSNSSRFGKYNRLFFDEAGALIDADITTYLLESSRVVVHGDRERTYHCFYEMLTGLSNERLRDLGLERGRAYRLTTCGEPVPGFEERDAKNFRRLCQALLTVGLDSTAIDSMIEVLAGLVHLGDIPADDSSLAQADREEDDSQAVDVNECHVEQAARLLGMDPDELCAVLRRKKVAVPGRKSIHEVPRSQPQFRQALHSLVKALYKRLFTRTVEHINGSFRELRPTDAEGGSEGAWNHIGILDIYGFERLQRNSFEQLCINLANERLQQYFVENVLVAEQSLYKREGLPWLSLALPDSQPVVNCITQVFRTLDEYSQLASNRGSASDEKFCLKVTDEASKDPQRKEVLRQLKPLGGRRASAVVGMVPPALNQGFAIKHYAGVVEYNTKGWLDKNNDRLLPECERLICESTCPLVSSLGEPDLGKTTSRSIAKRYVADLEGLLKTLNTCSLHYIRCFKPNEQQRPDDFYPQLVLDQIVQCGTIELVKVMHDGYPNRCSFEEISARFRSLLPESFQRYGLRTFIEALMLAYEVPRDEWALGVSRLFLKAGQLRALEDMRFEGAQPKAEKLASIVGSIIRKRWSRAGNAVRLCNYLPKFLAQVYERRARRQLARRRLRGAFHAVQFARLVAADLARRRRARLVAALRVAAVLHVRARKWLAAARKTIADALARRRAEEERLRAEEERRVAEELERRRAEEARRQEEEKQRLEAERREQERLQLELERLRLEEERRRLEEARAQREEEERQRLLREEEERRILEEQRKRMEEERLRREEEEREREAERLRLLEQQREEEAQRIKEERRVFEEERKVFEEERKVLEQKRRMFVLAQASPQRPHSREKNTGVSLVEEFAQAEVKECCTGETQAFVGLGEDEEVFPGDSASLVVSQVSTLVPHAVAVQINERIKQLEREMARKQEEVMQQMRVLQEKNESLERTLAEERAHRDDPSTGGTSIRAPSSLFASPTNSSLSRSDYHGFFGGHQPDLARTGSAPLSSSRPAVGHREKRKSVAQEAFFAMEQETRERGGGSQLQLPDVPGCSGDIQRRWLAEQRDNLLEELYPNGSPTVAFARTPARDPWKGLGIVTGEASSSSREVCNLTSVFESAQENSAAEPGGQAHQVDFGFDSGTKPRPHTASQFYWSKRGSTGGFSGSPPASA